jgi:hypothetical protein
VLEGYDPPLDIRQPSFYQELLASGEVLEYYLKVDQPKLGAVPITNKSYIEGYRDNI